MAAFAGSKTGYISQCKMGLYTEPSLYGEKYIVSICCKLSHAALSLKKLSPSSMISANLKRRWILIFRVSCNCIFLVVIKITIMFYKIAYCFLVTNYNVQILVDSKKLFVWYLLSMSQKMSEESLFLKAMLYWNPSIPWYGGFLAK